MAVLFAVLFAVHSVRWHLTVIEQYPAQFAKRPTVLPIIRTNCIYTTCLSLATMHPSQLAKERYVMSVVNESGVIEPAAAPANQPSPLISKALEIPPWQSPTLLSAFPPVEQWRVLSDADLIEVDEAELHRRVQQPPVPDQTNWRGKISDSVIKGIRMIELVIPPGQERLVPAAECSALHADILLRDQARFGDWRALCKQVFNAMLASPLFLVLVLSGNYIWLLPWFVLSLTDTLFSARRSLKQLSRTPQQYLAGCAANLRYGVWIVVNPDKGKARWRILALMALWAIIFVVEKQVWNTAGHGLGVIAAAGLVKTAVLAEPWRLVSGTLLHSSFIHLLCNAMVLFSLGILLARVTHYRLVIPVWLAGAIGGSLFSWWWLPNPSLGASGGVMALLGCLVAFAWCQRAFLPPVFLRDLLRNLGMMVGIGLLAWEIIDNAAHAGGLLAGLLIGLLLFRTPQLAFPLADSRRIWVVGSAAEWGVLGFAGFTLMKLLA